ncbi:MAG: hypothetical protein IKI18_04490 [Prevotella sp.]|nr:hypothetical protein [Prevotella sp.]
MAAYTMVSVPKQSNNQGLANGKKNVVIVFDFDKVKGDGYVRDEKGISVTKLEFVQDYTPIGLFVDESSIDAGDTVGGENYGRGFNHSFKFNHPGDDLAFAEFKANNINGSLGVIYVPCDSSKPCKVYGTPCQPLKMTKADEIDNNENNRQEVELNTDSLTWPVGRIAKADIPATDNAEINAYLGIGGQNGGV